MKKFRNLFFYAGVIGFFSLLIAWILKKGEWLQAGISGKVGVADSHWRQFIVTLRHNLADPLAILLLQIITIIIAARILGYLCKKIRQPAVVGEIIAGILLGPSFVGLYFPHFSALLFPATSLGNLQFLSQIGLVLFMFIVGMELDLKVLRSRAHDAVVVSHASIILPFTLGVGLAYFIYQRFAPPHVPFLSFALFIGISMSITAFPVLARIVQERELTKTRLGSLVITCAAADDITAWCILAAVIAIVKAGSFTSSVYTILLAVGYVFLMLKVLRPFLKKLGDIYSSRENLGKPVVAIFLLMLILSSYFTQVIGIHALFGAFMAGVIMPSNRNFRSIFIEKIEDISLVLLLPLFFVYTGLRTQISLLNDPALWIVCGLVILVAVGGKFLGSALAAKFVGQSWRDSLMTGALMNTRGLVELVALNIGYDLGVLTPQIFAMLVIMALATTFMTGPAMDLINWVGSRGKPRGVPEDIEERRKYRILIAFGNPEGGRSLLQLAYSFIRKSPFHASISALHASPVSEINQYNREEYERQSFLPLRTEAKEIGLEVKSLFKPSVDIDKSVADTANDGGYDFMLIGAGQSIYTGSVLGKILGVTSRIINPERLMDSFTGKEKLWEAVFDERVREIIRHTRIPTGIFINKGLNGLKKIFIPLFSPNDYFLLQYAQKLIHNQEAGVVILDAAGTLRHDSLIREAIRSIEQTAPNHIAFYEETVIEKEFLDQQDLMIIGIGSWKKLIETRSVWLAHVASVLVIKP